MKLTTTLNKIRACSPCTSGWQTLLKHVGKDFNPDAEINLLTILQSNGVVDMLWTLRATDQDSKRIASQLAIEFAEQALPIFEKRRPDDARPRKAIQAARDYLDGKISLEELQACQSHADAAADAAAAYAAAAAAAAADAAAYAAGRRRTATATAYAAAAYAADAAADAAYAAAAYADAAREKAREKQAEIIRTILEP
jgi:hypothetical protein